MPLYWWNPPGAASEIRQHQTPRRFRVSGVNRRSQGDGPVAWVPRVLNGDVGAIHPVLPQPGDHRSARKQILRGDSQVGQTGLSASVFHGRAGPHRHRGVRCRGEVGEIDHQRAPSCRTLSYGNSQGGQVSDGVGNDPLPARSQRIHSRARSHAEGRPIGVVDLPCRRSPVGESHLGGEEGSRCSSLRPQHHGHKQPAPDSGGHREGLRAHRHAPWSDHADRAAGRPPRHHGLDASPRHNLELDCTDSVEPYSCGAQEMGSGQGDPRACRPSCRGETGQGRGKHHREGFRAHGRAPWRHHADRAAGRPPRHHGLDASPRHNLELDSTDSVDIGGAQEMGPGQGDPRACRPSCRGETGQGRGKHHREGFRAHAVFPP